MRGMLFFLIVIGIFVGIAFLVRYMGRKANRKIWQSSLIDRLAFFYPYGVLLAIGLILASSSAGRRHLMMEISTTLAFVLFVLSMALLLALPVTFIIYFLYRAVFAAQQKSKKQTKAFSVEKRATLKWMTGAVPLLFLGASARGFAGAFHQVQTPQIELHFKNLPRALIDFKILHLSDLHLGYYFNLDDLEHLVATLSGQTFDLVVITGDCADDIKQLPDALQLIDQIPATHRKFFSLGNHEYFRGLPQILKIIDRSPVELLRDRSVTLDHRGTLLRLTGIDDPVFMGRDISDFLQKAIQAGTANAPPLPFNILLSHRPQALDFAPPFGIDLVLAGHTHGGQLGFNGRSLFENWNIHKYLWGPYRNGATQLYTSAGVGHWFPFRLGCPPEAPIIILKNDPDVNI
ncbi:metallophosphoesterase [Calditrichota bacterium GD2]